MGSLFLTPSDLHGRGLRKARDGLASVGEAGAELGYWELFPHASSCFYVCRGSGGNWGGENLTREQSYFWGLQSLCQGGGLMGGVGDWMQEVEI